MFSKSKQALLITLFTVFPLWSDAVEPNLRLFGTLLIPPPCVIQDNGMISVYFGNNVGANRIDGINYTQPVNYTLKCEGNSTQWALGLSIIGIKSQFDDAALQTNITDLAIHITRDGEPFILNERFVITPNKPPIIQAVPVKRPGSTLQKGAFETTATLLAEYQ
ncbi:fimbrial protein [Proteus sp. CD3]|uniref:fimbrial protein n=1 Tax=Proteus sp. CD3 TaxID=1921565 RepID=UPI00124A2240|nr:fimbrial protein [Proteus sp. CD3]QEZ91368.1 pilus assembly protein [Proteus sp. CD3]